MSALLKFVFESSPIRVLSDANGEPLFVAKDVAEVLGYSNTSDAINSHCKGVAQSYPLQTAGGLQEVRVIREPDLYRLIFKSTLPSAQAFERLVVEEILPTIRKTGKYAVPVNSLDALSLMVEHLRDQDRKMGQLEHQQQTLTEKVDAMVRGEDFITLAGWLNLRGYRLDTTITGPLGKRVAKHCRFVGQRIGSMWSPLAQITINTYPRELLDLLLGGDYPERF